MGGLEVPVLVVGGGGAGLTASMLLSTLGVESLLVNALPVTSTLPKAHILNQRAMEIMSDTGVADRIYSVGTPPEPTRADSWLFQRRSSFHHRSPLPDCSQSSTVSTIAPLASSTHTAM